MVYDFEECKKFSQIGVDNVVNYLKSLDETLFVIDVDEDPEYRLKDIDLLWVGYRSNFMSCSVEVKADSYSTGNLVLEVLSNKESGVDGWLYKSQADYLFYNFVNEGDLYIFKLPDVRDWFDSRKDDYRLISARTGRGSGVYTTVSHLVPVSVLRENLGGRYVSLT